MWTFFSVSLALAQESSCIYAITDKYDDVLEAKDFRIFGHVNTPEELEEEVDNLVKSAGVFFYTHTDGAEHIVPLSSVEGYYVGNTRLDGEVIHINGTDLVRYRTNQALGINTNEMYHNAGREILLLEGTLSARFAITEDTYVTVPVLELTMGSMHSNKGNTYLTKTDFYTEDGSVRMRTRMAKNGFETKVEIYDGNLDPIQSTTYTKNNAVIQSVTTTYTRNARGLVTEQTVTDNTPGGETITTSATYNDLDFLVSVTDEFGTITSYTTDARWGVVTDVSIENGSCISDTFDDDCSTQTSRGFGNTEPTKEHAFAYENGALSTISDSTLTYGFGYDESGLLSSVSKNGLSIEQVATTDNGKVVATSYPTEASPLFTTTQRYNKYGRLTAIDGVLTCTYDVNPTQNWDVYSTTGVDNIAGKLATATDHLTGNVRKYAYQGNKISSISEFDAEGSYLNYESFQYDEYGRLQQSEFAWDIDQVKRTRQDFTYTSANDDGYPSDTVKASTYLVDGFQWLSTSNTYDAFGRLSRKGLGLGQTGGFYRNYIYNKTRVHTVKDDWNLTELGRCVYSYDAMGRVKTVSYTAKDGTNKYTTYEYDQFGQLVRENNEGLAKTIVYVYNDIGNITSIKEYAYTLSSILTGAYTERVYAYNAFCPDRLSNRDGTLLLYNSMGYPTSYGGKVCTWTKDKLTRLRKGNSTQAGSLYEDCVFAYDAYGRRLSKSYTYDPNPASGSDTSYTYNITYTYDNSGRLLREYCTGAYTFTGGFSYTREFIYLYDESGIVGVLYSYNGAARKSYFFHKNLQGDVIAICDESGNVVGEYAYDAWGNCTIKKSNGDLTNYNPIRYRGYYYDRETNLYFVGGRYYDPTCGRFISPDGVENLNPSAHFGLNLYLYAGNDPVNGVYGGASAITRESAGGAAVAFSGLKLSNGIVSGNYSLIKAPSLYGALCFASNAFAILNGIKVAEYLTHIHGNPPKVGWFLENLYKADTISFILGCASAVVDGFNVWNQTGDLVKAIMTGAYDVGAMFIAGKLGGLLGGLVGGPAGAIVGTLIGIGIEELFQLVKEDIVNWIDKTIDEIVYGSKMERVVYA